MSHAWKDKGKKGERKVEMLIEFLCLDALLGQLSVISLVLSVFTLPLGLAVTSYVPSFPFWSLCLVPLAVFLFVTGWTVASLHRWIRSTAAPWAFSSTTLWLDKCCICQETPETIGAGVASFKRFLCKCDKLVVFASEEYFHRLWCAARPDPPLRRPP